MYLNEFAKEVHQNAIAHGWWGEEYTDAVVIALIHAEISEAFEEWRANRPMVWHQCLVEDGLCVCEMEDCAHLIAKNDCAMNRQGDKPEGIAVELIDVVLRILDAAAAWGVPLDDYDFNSSEVFMNQLYDERVRRLTIPELVCELHSHVTDIRHRHKPYIDQESLSTAMNIPLDLIFAWCRANSIDPEMLLLEKHEYNKTRPYRHGGKRV